MYDAGRYALTGRSMRTSGGSRLASPRSSPRRLLEEPHVHLETDGLDVAVLLGPQHVAGAADLEVAHRDRHARAELGVLRERLQPLVRRRRESDVAREEQVRVRLLTGAADASAQLVELREAEPVGTVDDQRVHASGCRDPLR